MSEGRVSSKMAIFWCFQEIRTKSGCQRLMSTVSRSVSCAPVSPRADKTSSDRRLGPASLAYCGSPGRLHAAGGRRRQQLPPSASSRRRAVSVKVQTRTACAERTGPAQCFIILSPRDWLVAAIPNSHYVRVRLGSTGRRRHALRQSRSPQQQLQPHTRVTLARGPVTVRAAQARCTSPTSQGPVRLPRSGRCRCQTAGTRIANLWAGICSDGCDHPPTRSAGATIGPALAAVERSCNPSGAAAGGHRVKVTLSPTFSTRLPI
jgi:hypothetical protein